MNRTANRATKRSKTPKRSKKPNRYELITCALGDHVVVGTDVRSIEPEDWAVVQEHDGVRWHRCLRCDSWMPRQPPEDPTRERLPSRDEIEIPLRGRSLRDRYALRVIAVERSIHVVVLAGLAAAVFLFIGHRNTLRRDYLSVINGLTGSSGGPDALGGFLGHFRDIFVISASDLYKIGLVLAAYAVLEAIEMVGLWRGNRWAEYLTFLATTAFVPLEVYELTSKFGVFKLLTFLVNMAIVIYLLVAKRLFGLRGGHAADSARRRADSGWAAIDRRPPGQPLRPLESHSEPAV